MDTTLVGFRRDSGLTMTSLDAAILMGDLKMVQKILLRMFQKRLRRGSHVIRAIERFVGRKIGYPGSKGLRCVHSNMATSALLNLIYETPQKIGFLYTHLHLAVATGDSCIIYELLLDKFTSRFNIGGNAGVNVENWLYQTPLDLAWKLGNVIVLKQLLESDEEKKDVLHVAMRYGDIELMRKLPSPNVNALDYKGKTPMHYLATIHRRHDVKNIVQYLACYLAPDVTTLDSSGLSTFYVATLCCNTKLVIALLDSFTDKIRLNEECDEGRGPPIQIAFEGGHSFKDIERALMECEPVKGYMDKLYRDRQVYVDAANAILVGAALIASVTFASWLQPPLNYTSYFGEGYSNSIPTPSTSNLDYVDVEHNIALRAFWVFNALSFYFDIATVVCGARSVLPRSHLFIKKTVEKLRTNLLVTSILLACSVLFVIIAFAIAGTIVLTPIVKYRWCMIVPTLVGGMVCIISLGFLVKSMREIYSNTHDNSEGLNLKDKDYLRNRGYIVPSIDSDT